MTTKNSPMGWFSLAIDAVLLMVVFFLFDVTWLAIVCAVFATIAIIMAERRRRLNARRAQIERKAAAIRTQRIRGSRQDQIGGTLPEVIR